MDIPETISLSASLQEKLDDLKWASNALKIIPSLPSGRARDKLAYDVNSLINASSTLTGSVEALIRKLSECASYLEDSMGGLTTLESTRNCKKRLDPKLVVYQLDLVKQGIQKVKEGLSGLISYP